MNKIYCVRTDDGYAEASVSIPPVMSVADLNRIKEQVCSNQNSSTEKNNPAASLVFGLTDDDKKLKVTVRFSTSMSNDAQLRILMAFRDALLPLVTIESFVLSGMTVH